MDGKFTKKDEPQVLIESFIGDNDEINVVAFEEIY